MENKKCVICESDFIGTKASKICSKECRRVLSSKIASKNYKKRKEEKQCLYCPSVFIGTKNQKLCENCCSTRRPKLQKVVKKIKCHQCNDVYSEIEKFKTNGDEVILGPTCPKCKEENKNKLIERMRSDDNPSIITYGRCIPIKRMTPEEFSIFQSERMTGNNNPMKNSETAAKVSVTIRENYASGKIKKITGNEHWLWKGNRDKNQVIRALLYPVWTKPILIRDGFKCVMCGEKKRRLEVHHLTRSFNDVVLQYLNGRKMCDLTYKEFKFVSNAVIEEHKNIDGITCCVDCHKDIDPHRH